MKSRAAVAVQQFIPLSEQLEATRQADGIRQAALASKSRMARARIQRRLHPAGTDTAVTAPQHLCAPVELLNTRTSELHLPQNGPVVLVKGSASSNAPTWRRPVSPMSPTKAVQLCHQHPAHLAGNYTPQSRHPHDQGTPSQRLNRVAMHQSIALGYCI